MGKRLNRLVFFVLLSCSPASFADWKPSELAWFREFERKEARFPDPNVATVWGAYLDPLPEGQKNRAENGDEARSGPTNSFQFFSDSLRTGSVETPLYLQRDLSRTGSSRREALAPLVLIMPGIFSDADSSFARHLAESLWRRGYHVAVFHNPWSPRMIRAQPDRKPGDPAFEASLLLQYGDAVVARIGRTKVSSVSLVGVSYGALVGAVAFAKDAESVKKRIDGEVFLIGPPLGLKEAAMNLDRGIDQYESRFRECRPIRYLREGVGKILFGKKAKQTGLSRRTLDCMAPSLYRAFRDKLVAACASIGSAYAVRSARGYDEVEADEWRWAPRKKGMRYSSAFEDYVRENLPLLDSAELKLSFWLNRLGGAELKRLRILSARDDMLNEGMNWSENESPAFSENISAQLPWGGHLGYVRTPEFQDLLDLVYGKLQ